MLWEVLRWEGLRKREGRVRNTGGRGWYIAIKSKRRLHVKSKRRLHVKVSKIEAVPARKGVNSQCKLETLCPCETGGHNRETVYVAWCKWHRELCP